MKLTRIWPVLAVAVVLAVVGAYFLHVIPGTQGSGTGASSSATLAPTFDAATIYGGNFSLSDYRSHSVVILEFTSLSCSECQIVEKQLDTLYSGYNSSGQTHVQILSIYTNPQFGDTIPALKAYHAKNNITWQMAQDTDSLALSRAYGVSPIPDLFIVDEQGHLVYNVVGVQSQSQIQSTVSSALAGKAAAITIVTVSVFALAAVAGVTTFFSPCAFPMFPGYMSLFLGLNASGTTGAAPGGSTTYKGAARRAVLAGSVTAVGMVLVFLVIGLALILAANAVGGYIPIFLLIVGAILVALGALLLTNLQYWRIVTPLQRLWGRIRGRDTGSAEVAPIGGGGQGLYLKLFSYGMGYAAAAAGCVAPVIFSAIVAGLAVGFVGGIINIAIFSATAALLMIGVTVALAMAGQKYVNQLKALTPVIKKISAAVLIVVGVYLVYFYYTAWGF